MQAFETARDIANTVFGFSERGLLVVIRAFFDASGKNETPVLTVGGYFAWDEVCSRIEEDWKAALLDAGYCNADGTAGVFHLSDFGTQYCKYGTSKWNLKTQRIPFLKKLASIVNRKDNHVVSFTIETSQVRDFLATCPHPQIYGPDYFSAVALYAFTFVEVQIDESGFKHQPVAYVFEKGDRQHETNISFMEYDSLHDDLGSRSLTFEPKELPLLQAADLTAGKINEVVERAHAALGFVDSGSPLTPVTRFERYYSHDGTSAALMDDCAVHNCYVLNKSHFVEADRRMMNVIRNNPVVIERRMKRNLLIPKA